MEIFLYFNVHLKPSSGFKEKNLSTQKNKNCWWRAQCPLHHRPTIFSTRHCSAYLRHLLLAPRSVVTRHLHRNEHFSLFFLHIGKAAATLVGFISLPFSPKDADLLDVESKHFEDLEFQQLERESRLDEEKENLTQQLLREVAEYQRNIVARKVVC